jgi:hypothetical protein
MKHLPHVEGGSTTTVMPYWTPVKWLVNQSNVTGTADYFRETRKEVGPSILP